MTLKEAAQDYAARGLKVFPLRGGGKIPLKGSNGVHDATTDTGKIWRWWTENPNYNIGLAMGDGFISLDFDEDDQKDKHGLETLRDWEREHGKRLPDTWIHNTPRGGVHYIYKDPFGYGNEDKLYHDVELKSTGKYIVAPPSRRDDGKEYFWEAGYSPEDMDAAVIDDTVREFLKGEPKEDKQTGSTRSTLPEKVYDGEQEIVFMWLVGKLWNLGLSDEAIRSVVSIENESRFEPSWTVDELEKTIFPALSRGWDVSHPYWKSQEGETEIWWLNKKIELMDQIIKRQQALLNL